jgi:hypothetical protein
MNDPLSPSEKAARLRQIQDRVEVLLVLYHGLDEINSLLTEASVIQGWIWG